MTELTDMVVKNMDTPRGLSENEDPQKKQEAIIRNKRAILQLFNIRVFVYPERVEIKGTISPQVMDKATKKEPETALIISSPSQTIG